MFVVFFLCFIDLWSQINAGRLTSIRNQTLQLIGRQYKKKLNINAKVDTKYRAAAFTPATAYVRCMVPYFEGECGLKHNFMGNRRNVRIRLARSHVVRMIQGWATSECVGDEKKGERNVTYFGRDNIFTYSFVTNQMALKFGVTNDAAPTQAKQKNSKRKANDNKSKKNT